ncbi:MAG: hypothetical protein AB8B95_08550 [Pseudohongiellaceae bacterium]
MIRTLFFLAISCLSQLSMAAETDASTARDYTFSMAGALINQHCEATWEQGSDISINACRYRVAQFYNFTIASAHFESCTETSRGDIIKIAECMTERFSGWTQSQKN